MNGVALLGLLLWLLLTLASVFAWLPRPPRPRPRPRTGGTLISLSVVGGHVLVTGGVAVLADAAGPLPAPWSWAVVGVAAAAAVLSGGAVTTGVLSLADASAQSAGVRVQRTVLRGGAWIGALERVILLGAVLAGWHEGLVAVIAVKAFARYPELKTGQATGAIERFIIGTFTSLGWAASCAGVARLLLH